MCEPEELTVSEGDREIAGRISAALFPVIGQTFVSYGRCKKFASHELIVLRNGMEYSVLCDVLTAEAIKAHVEDVIRAFRKQGMKAAK